VRYPLLMPFIILCPAIMAPAQVSIGISLPGLSIGINQPVYPELVQVPGYPVYYAPGSSMNYFFYDGLYWVYQNNEWYSSEWYNGPWSGIQPYDVPLFVLRVPVSYYRQPPPYFGGWDRNAPPRWGEHWGHDWEQRRGGWDHWDRHAAPAPAPLPTYQRQFSGGRYPRPEQQQALHSQNYHYQPKEAVTQAHYQQQRQQAPAARQQPAPGPRPGNPPQAQHQQPAPGPRPGNPPQAQHLQPAPGPRPGNPPPQAQHEQPHAQPPPQQNREAPRPSAQHQGQGQGQPREPVKGQHEPG
jgi:hypothetical protein